MNERILNAEDAPAVLAEWEIERGGRIGVITLNVPKTLNSLTLEMIDAMDAQLRAWAEAPEVVAVYLRGAGERAFCAGGDIQALYRSMVANHEAGELVDRYAETFFEHEYRLDHRIHVYPKPVVCFGHGVVMGGGLGILSAASHRVVTESSRVAMPEITIGLFPDAGGTTLLSSMPGHFGLFLGLTGAQINGADAVEVGLGRFLLRTEARESLERGLLEARWHGDAEQDRAMLDVLLGNLDAEAREARPAPQAGPLRRTIDEALAEADGDYTAAINGVRKLRGHGGWIDRAVDTMEAGCPVTAGIVVEQLRRAKDLSLADRFRMEMVIGTHCARNRDFAEGVRALLIDKDRSPQWSVEGLDALSPKTVQAHFEPPWDENPLADLRDP
ncbi:MAG: enoyl-CoA hydratase/isomerase family protein [Pseudomonadales bacterium]|jgi:enoyl-CoA hydratase/carnithine racemase|nr:enoyl-CoA hydratase/isomerase family protein [Pseudomonadales bacterium]